MVGQGLCIARISSIPARRAVSSVEMDMSQLVLLLSCLYVPVMNCTDLLLRISNHIYNPSCIQLVLGLRFSIRFLRSGRLV